MKELSVTVLRIAERLFLYAHGWRKVGRDEYEPPSTYSRRRPDQKYRGGHAINSQKYTNHSMRRLGRRLNEEEEET